MNTENRLRTRKYLPAGHRRYSADCLGGATDSKFSLGFDNVLRTTVTLDNQYTFEVISVSKWDGRKGTATITFRFRPNHDGEDSLEYRIRIGRKWQWKQFYDNYLSAHLANSRREIVPNAELDAIVADVIAVGDNKIQAIAAIRKATGVGLGAAKNYVDARWHTPVVPVEFNGGDRIHARGMGVLLQWPTQGEDHGK